MPIKKKSNEKGITLVEVLAVLALSSMILIMLINIFLQGKKSYTNSIENINLEQQGQIIIENIRAKHLLTDSYTLEVGENLLKLNDEIVSEGLTYELEINGKYLQLDEAITIISDEIPTELIMTLTKNGKKYNSRTVLEKWYQKPILKTK